MIFLLYAIKLAETQNLHSAPVTLLTLKGHDAKTKHPDGLLSLGR